MRLVWCTDVHLDHCRNIPMFIDDVFTMQPDRILFTGDISNSLQIVKHLATLADQLDCPIDLILGNHDFYGESQYVPAKMSDTRKRVANICKEFDNLNWLEHSGPIKLTDEAALIGNSLWCDWRAGVGDKSTVWLNDYLLIADLFGYPTSHSDRANIKKKVRSIADNSTKQLMKDFNKAIDQGFKNIIIGTHVPPFHGVSYYNGKIQDDNWAPHFVCKIAGDKLKAAAIKNPDVDITLLFGHTHGFGKKRILKNLYAINGGATYGHPAPQTPIIINK